MNVNKITIYNNKLSCQKPSENKAADLSQVPVYGLQKSVYNAGGTGIYFGCLASGADSIENECIEILRAARNGVKRRFAEDDITDILRRLKVVKQPADKKNILMEALELNEEYTGLTPSSEIFKNIISLTAPRQEQERFAILEFAANELQNATKPLETFYKLPIDKQDNLTQLLVKIDDLNYQNMFKDNEARESIVKSLYNTFKVPLYAHKDVAKMDVSLVHGYKDKNLQILDADMDFYEKQDCYANEVAKSKVISVVESIINYFVENV